MANQSIDFEFELTGFPGTPPSLHIPVSIAMFVMYNITLICNGSVVVLIIMKKKLHKPLYILIANLSFCHLLFDSVTLPKFIAKYWFDGGRISFAECLFQTCLVHYLGGMDSFILLLMSFDRYIAICKPLRYSAIVSLKVTLVFCGALWLSMVAFGFSSLVIVKHPFCGPNKIVNLFCNSSTMLRLVCDDVTATREILLAIALSVLFVPLAFIILSYAVIIVSIVCSHHSKDWRKALSTCTTHWIVLTLFYLPRVFVYIANYAHLVLSPDLNVFLIFLHSYLPHLANPLIYCLRTEEIRRTIMVIIRREIVIQM
ncbi:olfactory receptor 4S1-like [Leptodactylus fuscus]|uniref:olfactory receptor 4S1-like n=1 Tax=Leptodactylus fuscus TaxID=238119 RepID=UPI003F4EC50C